MTPIKRPLTSAEMSALGRYIPRIDLESAVLHMGRVPWYLPRRFGGIARGRHIYFRHGAYREGSAEGIALLGHELTHVGQYRHGMTAISYLWSAIFGYRNSPFERAAYAIEARILEELTGATGCADHEAPVDAR